ncbi:MAG: sigma-70 family RNA polymerase sigma factor [Spirochaetota bacterium]
MTATAPNPFSAEGPTPLIEALTIAAFNGCSKSQETLVIQSLGILSQILKGYRISGEINHDCRSEATIAVIKAVRTFNPYRRFSLSSYISWHIHAAIKKALRENKLIHIPKNKWYQMKAAEESAGSLRTTNTTLSPAELPQTSLFSEIQFEPDSISVSSRSEDPAALAERSYLEAVICDGLGQLSDFEKQVISGRYGINQKKPVSSREMAVKLNCSRSAVLKAEQTAKRSLRQFFESKGLRSFIGGE